MINVLYAFNGVFHKGGTESVILNYYNNIDRERYHIDFLVHGYEEQCIDNETHNYLLSCGSKIYYVTPRGKNYIKCQKEIRKIFKHNHYDIVHTHMDIAGYFVLKDAKKYGVSLCISHAHSTSSSECSSNAVKRIIYKTIHLITKKRLSFVSDVRIACSTEAGNWLYNKKSYIVLNNGVNVEKYSYNQQKRDNIRKKLNIDDEIVIGHVGRFDVVKNHNFIIDVFFEFQSVHPNSKLILVGIGEFMDIIKEKVYNLRIADKVIFLGLRNDVDELMQSFDVFLLPSLYEGLPLVAVEAQASGLPCVISSTVSQEVKLTEFVKFVSLNAPLSDWCKTIEQLYYKSNIRENGSIIVKKSGFDISDVIVRLMKIYDQILPKG